MSRIKIVAFAGSLRKNSFNKMALKYAVLGLEKTGAEVDLVDLKELDIPVYDADVEEEGLPRGVEELKERVSKADGVLLALPEYNWGVPGVLKNAIDWVSRPPKNEFEGKTVAYFGASDGYFGTVRSQIIILPTLITLGMYILPRKVYIPNGGDEFDEDGKLKNAKIEGKLKKLGADLVEFTRKLK